MAKRKEDCLEKLVKDTGAKRDAAYDVLVEMLSELVKTKEKYDRLAGLLEKHGRVPDDLRDIETLCVEAGSDETLDRLMDIAGCDTLDEFEAFVQRRADYRKAPENKLGIKYPKDGGVKCHTKRKSTRLSKTSSRRSTTAF